MLAILIFLLIIFIGLFWLGVLTVEWFIFNRKGDYSNPIYVMITGLIFLLFAFFIQFMNRDIVRREIVKIESIRETLKNMPKNQIENTGVMEIIIEENIWLTEHKLKNTWFWVGDLSTDDSIMNVKPLALN